MIRNACVHVENEQPLLVDLFDLPASTDAGLLCTNVRMLDGKRPVFIDRIEATFFFPYHVIRFVEIPVGAMQGHVPGPAAGGPGAATRNAMDNAADGADARMPVPIGDSTPPGPEDPDAEIEIDEGFLQRIREI